jgi:hypothetical protein
MNAVINFNNFNIQVQASKSLKYALLSCMQPPGIKTVWGDYVMHLDGLPIPPSPASADVGERVAFGPALKVWIDRLCAIRKIRRTPLSLAEYGPSDYVKLITAQQLLDAILQAKVLWDVVGTILVVHKASLEVLVTQIAIDALEQEMKKLREVLDRQLNTHQSVLEGKAEPPRLSCAERANRTRALLLGLSTRDLKLVPPVQ